MLKFASLALAAAAIAAAPAAAQPASDGYMVVVPYGDLDLSTNEGTKVLKGRMKATANKICGPHVPGNVADALRSVTCRSQVLNAVKPQLERALSQHAAASGAIRATR